MEINHIRKLLECVAELDIKKFYLAEFYWEELTDIFIEDINATLDFFKTECTDDELWLLGTIFEDIIEKTQCEELITVWKNRLAAVKPEKFQQNICEGNQIKKGVSYEDYVESLMMDIEFARERINTIN